MAEKIKLNLGAGNKILEGYDNHDLIKRDGITYVWDLEITPYPIVNEYYDFILVDNVYEHIHNVVGMMKEIHRILKPGGTVKIICPYYNHPNAWNEPTHIRGVNEDQFRNFIGTIDDSEYNCYDGKKFKEMKIEYRYTSIGKYLPFKKQLRHCCGLIVSAIIVEIKKGDWSPEFNGILGGKENENDN